MNIIERFFGRKNNDDNYIEKLELQLKSLEKEVQSLRFQLSENDLEYRDTLIKYQINNDKLKEKNKDISSKISQIITICDIFKDEEEEEDEDEDEEEID